MTRRTSGRQWLLIVLLMQVAHTISYAGVFQNELTLWTWTAAHAPLKPRPFVNLALAEMERRDYAHAWQHLQYVRGLLATVPLSDTDRASTLKAVTQDDAALARLLEPLR